MFPFQKHCSHRLTSLSHSPYEATASSSSSQTKSSQYNCSSLRSRFLGGRGIYCHSYSLRRMAAFNRSSQHHTFQYNSSKCHQRFLVGIPIQFHCTVSSDVRFSLFSFHAKRASVPFPFPLPLPVFHHSLIEIVKRAEFRTVPHSLFLTITSDQI